MKKIFHCIAIFLIVFTQIGFSQNPNRVSIRGAVKDTLGGEIPYATVMLLNPTDTTLVNFTRSDDKGLFAFKNVKNSPYLLKITYISFLPYQKRLEPSPTETNDLGNVTIKPISEALMEVVIKAAKAPLRIRGDTIEYDATTFKVPEGSTVEDLLRRLPGIEVDADGNIKSQGRDVNKVYVDGKTFFGSDPKSATKNLGAETISKVQVYDDKSEQAKLTGVDDGKKEKAMNLELKEEFKKGSFGKVTAAAGTSERWAGRGNYNRFNEKQQLSFIAYGNNINQTGINWEDYGEFKGQNTFNNEDNGDFGFSGGGRMFFWGGGDDDSPLNNFDGRGFTKNFGGGSNYNFDNKKTRLNLNYFYNETALDLDQYALRQSFLQDSSFFNTDTTNQHNFRGKHSIGTRIEHNLDSSNLIIAKGDLRFTQSNNNNRQSQLFYPSNEQPTNSLFLNNLEQLRSWRLASSAIFRHRFKKKGRSFALSAGYNNNLSDGTENIFSLNRFFRATTFEEQIKQLNTRNAATGQYKSSALFTEPLSKKWFSEAFYNFRLTDNTIDRQVNNPLLNNARVDNLSVYYKNTNLYNRIGSGIRYSYKGLNASAGLAVQQIQLGGEYARSENEPLLAPRLVRKFNNLTPNISINNEFPKNIFVSLGYNYGVSEPNFNDLQPVPNVNNPAFRILGNPNLTPQKMHNFNVNLNYWNPASFSYFGINSDINLFDSQIVYAQTIEAIDSIGIRTTTLPINVNKGNNLNAWMWGGFPIVKTKLTANLNGGINWGNTPSFVNSVENQTKNRGYNLNFNLNFTPFSKLIVNAGASANFNYITYSIQASQNQNIKNYGVDASVKWQFAHKFFFESSFDYNVYRNDRFDFNQNIPIWNGSVRRLFGKTNRWETRLAAFDILNKRVSITQSGTQNYVIRNVANTLARYYMLSVSYNIRGYENKLSKNNWW